MPLPRPGDFWDLDRAGGLQPFSARVVQHRNSPSRRTIEVLRALRDALHRGTGDYRNPGTIALPASLVESAVREMDRMSTEIVNISVPEPFLPVSPPPKAVPAVTGISEAHMELLRQIVDAGVEWDMIGAAEGAALLASVGAVKPNVGNGKTAVQQSLKQQLDQSRFSGQVYDDTLLERFANMTATEMREQMFTATGRLASTNMSTVSTTSSRLPTAEEIGRQLVDLERMMTNSDAHLMQLSRGQWETLSNVAREPVPQPPVPPLTQPYPSPRSRFSRPGGR